MDIDKQRQRERWRRGGRDRERLTDAHTCTHRQIMVMMVRWW